LSDTDSFISEVSEEVRRERFYGFLRRYGWLIALLVLLAVGGAAINEFMKARRLAAAEATGDALRAALVTADAGTRAQLLADLGDAHPGARPLIALAGAGALAESGDPAGATASLLAIAEVSSAPTEYRDLASLLSLGAGSDNADDSVRGAILERLTASASPWTNLAIEQRALDGIAASDIEAAKTDLQSLVQGVGLSEGIVARARQLLIAIGGSLPAETPAESGAAVQPADG
jgi:hypothetical protein